MKRSVTITTDQLISLLREKNIQIQQSSLGGNCKAVARKYRDGYIILVEESLSFDALIIAIQHEMYHILLGHLDDDTKTRASKEFEVNDMMRSFCYSYQKC